MNKCHIYVIQIAQSLPVINPHCATNSSILIHMVKVFILLPLKKRYSYCETPESALGRDSALTQHTMQSALDTIINRESRAGTLSFPPSPA